MRAKNRGHEPGVPARSHKYCADDRYRHFPAIETNLQNEGSRSERRSFPRRAWALSVKAYGNRIVEPVVLRSLSSVWAVAASLSG